MRIYLLVLANCLVIFSCRNDTGSHYNLDYPYTDKVEQVDDFFGQLVDDPYRWLENDTTAKVENWVKAQNIFTYSYLNKIPFREKISERCTSLYNFSRISNPLKAGKYFFFYKNDGLQNQAVIYLKKGVEAEPEVFLDPNKLSEKGIVSIRLLGVSEDNRYIAYARSDAGSDWSEIRVIDIETKETLTDRVMWMKFSDISWYKNGFFYSRFPKPEKGKKCPERSTYQKVYYHRLGDEQSKDKVIYQDEAHPKRLYEAFITRDQAYIVLTASSGTNGFETYFKPTNLSEGGFKPLFKGFDYKNSIIDHIDGKFFVLTNVDAPNYRLVTVDPAHPEVANWKDVIPEERSLLRSVSFVGGKWFLSYLDHAYSRVYQCEFDGTKRQEIELPALGTVFLGNGEKSDHTIFYTFNSFLYPTSIYEYNLRTETSTVFFKPEVELDPSAYESKQVFFTSKDGTRVSMFLVHKKGLSRNGNNPTLLYGYGGFNISLTPQFDPANLFLLENGGIYAMPNLRGGGEYGEEWHKAGMLDKKQNVFDDFIAAAEFLIEEGYTSPSKLAIHGASNGGLLVGATMTQRPDLFAVAFPSVGVMDMLRYHKFTIGWAWTVEYGNVEKDKEVFDYIYKYSPLHNMSEGVTYPATMVTTADHDDRVVPAHSFKFIARLQEAHKGQDPVLIRIETDAGHGLGKPISKIIAERTDMWTFMWHHVGETLHE